MLRLKHVLGLLLAASLVAQNAHGAHSSIMGIQWNRAASLAGWTARSSQSAIASTTKLWVLGGRYSSLEHNDVWSSSDGAAWSQVTGAASWPVRQDHASLYFSSKLWVLGGWTSVSGVGPRFGDVWYSTTGSSWTQATGATSWLPRSAHAALVFNSKMWVLGGATTLGAVPKNDVWYSSDGKNWTCATSSAAWPARWYHSALVMNNKMWIMGGTDDFGQLFHDVWSSSDGVTWTRATASAAWSARSMLTSQAFGGKMWVMGGSDGSNKNDVWYSSDGITWSLATASAGWGTRSTLSSVVFDNRMWVYGGSRSDVWWTPVDTDIDNMADDWETTYFAGLTHTGSADGDADGLSDLLEYQNSTNPTDADSDNDGFNDGLEISAGTNPNLASSMPTLPTAAFSGTPLTGTVPLSVTFTDSSTAGSGAITARAWDFDNNGSTDSTVQNPTYQFSSAGTYTVKLTVTTAYGSDSETKSSYVQVSKATPSVTAWPSASSLTYGQSLASSTLSGGSASVTGTFTFETPATSPDVGTTAVNVVFTPTDTANYNALTGSVNVTVTRATPSISAWPTATTITYGQTVGDSTLNGGSANVAGVFRLYQPTVVPSAGTYSAQVKFSPDDLLRYIAVMGVSSITVNKATPDVSAWPAASSIVYGQTLSDATLSGGAADVPGAFTFTTPSTLPETGTYSASVTFTPTDTANYHTATGAVDVNVTKATPTVSAWPTASNITEGTALSTSTLAGGTASVPGSFAFATPSTQPGRGVYSAAATFTPTDTAHYNAVDGSVDVTVDAAQGGIPTGIAWSTYFGGIGEDTGAAVATDTEGNIYTTGATQSAGWVSGGADLLFDGGKDLYVTKVSPTGEHKWSTYLGGANDDSGRSIAVDAEDNVIVVGTTASDAWVSGGWKTALAGGTDAFVVKFSPAGSVLWSTYLGGTGDDQGQQITVDASGNIFATGHTSSSDWVSGGWDTSQNGGQDGYVVKLDASGGHLWSTYLGGANTEYGYGIAVDGTGNVYITGGTLSAGWVSDGPDTVLDGTQDAYIVKLGTNGGHLWSTYLGGTGIDEGLCARIDANENLYVAGYTTSSGWVSGGSDTSFGGGADGFVAKLDVDGPVLWSSYIGGADSEDTDDLAFDKSGDVYATGLSGSAGWTASGWNTTHGGVRDAYLAKLSSTGSHQWSSYLGGTAVDCGTSVAIDSAGNLYLTGYTASSGWISGGWDTSYGGGAFDSFLAKVGANKLTPVIDAWPSATGISYGQNLSLSALSGGSARVNGAFAFTDNTEAPDAGSYAASVTFTPGDTATYASVAGTVTVTVTQAAPAVSQWPSASAIVYGQTLSTSALTGGAAAVAGHFVFENPDNTPPVGNNAVDLLFVPDDGENYAQQTGTAEVVVEKATPVVSQWPEAAAAITHGQALSEAGLGGGEASVPGTFAYETPDATPDAGMYLAALVFTPTDSTNITTLSGTASVTVNKATPTLSPPTAAAITYGQALESAILSGGTASTEGVFAYLNPEIEPSGGEFTASISFTPEDLGNFEIVYTTINVTVNKAGAAVSSWPVPSAILYGQPLSASSLTGGESAVPGSFAFTAPATVPAAAGAFTASITFTPNDSANYSAAATDVELTVNKATPVVSLWPAASSIAEGTTLSGSILSGGNADVEGSFSFTAPSTVPAAGAYEAPVTFTPTDTENYEVLAGTVTVQVNASEEAAEGELPEGETPAEGMPEEGESPCGGTCDVRLDLPNLFLSPPTQTQGPSVLIPISVDSAERVSPSGMDIILYYDETFLDASTVSVEPTAITGRTSFTANVSRPGEVHITTMGDVGQLRGSGHLFDVRAAAVAQPRGLCGDLMFGMVALYDEDLNLISVDSSDTGEVCQSEEAYQGDVNGDGITNIADAMTVLKLAVGQPVMQSGTETPITLESAIRAADLNGDGVLDSADAVMLQRYVTGLPVNPGAYEGAADADLLSVALEDVDKMTVVVEDASGDEGGTIPVSVTATTANALSGYDFTLRYDPEILRPIAVNKGTVVGTGKQEWELDGENGALHVSMGRPTAYHSKAINSLLATIEFEVLSVPEGGSSTLTLENLALKGQFGDDFGWYTQVSPRSGDVFIEPVPPVQCGFLPLRTPSAAGDLLFLVLSAILLAAGRVLRGIRNLRLLS